MVCQHRRPTTEDTLGQATSILQEFGTHRWQYVFPISINEVLPFYYQNRNGIVPLRVLSSLMSMLYCFQWIWVSSCGWDMIGKVMIVIIQHLSECDSMLAMETLTVIQGIYFVKLCNVSRFTIETDYNNYVKELQFRWQMFL